MFGKFSGGGGPAGGGGGYVAIFPSFLLFARPKKNKTKSRIDSQPSEPFKRTVFAPAAALPEPAPQSRIAHALSQRTEANGLVYHGWVVV